MPVYAEGRVEHQKRTQTATTLWPFGFVFGVQLGLLEKKKTRRGPVRAALFHIYPTLSVQIKVTPNYRYVFIILTFFRGFVKI